MGNTFTRCCKSNDAVDATLDLSATHREALATWLRQNVPVTDVYEIMDTLGEGHMGVVYKIRRKVETDGLHNDLTRLKVLKGDGSDEDAEKGNGLARSGSLQLPRVIRKEFTPSDHSDGHGIPTLALKSLVRKTSSLQDNDDASDKEAPSITDHHNGKPKSILKNVSHLNLKSVSKAHDSISNEDDDEDDDEVEGNNDEHQMNGSDEEPKAVHLERRDSLQVNKERNKHPKFDTILDACGIACGITDDSAPISIDNGSDTDKEHSKKDSKWVPQRTIRFQRLYACKTIATDHIQKDEMKELMNEIYMMRKMDHPYIIRLYEVYQEHSKYIYFTYRYGTFL